MAQMQNPFTFRDWVASRKQQSWRENVKTEEAAIGSHLGSGPQNSEHMKFKGKEEESIQKGEKTGEKQLAAKFHQFMLDLVGLGS